MKHDVGLAPVSSIMSRVSSPAPTSLPNIKIPVDETMKTQSPKCDHENMQFKVHTMPEKDSSHSQIAVKQPKEAKVFKAGILIHYTHVVTI